MDYKYLSPEEGEHGSIALLSENFVSCKRIAEELHSSKSDLAYLRYVLYDIQKQIHEGQAFDTFIDDIKKMLDSYLMKVKDVELALFPGYIMQLGFVKQLEIQIKEIEVAYSTTIKSSILLDDFSNYDLMQTINLCKVCKDILEFFIQKDNVVNFALRIKSGELFVKINGFGPKSNRDPTRDLIPLIKGRLAWLKSRISTATNWENEVSFVISLIELPEYDN